MLALLLELQILRKQTIAAVFFSSRSDFGQNVPVDLDRSRQGQAKGDYICASTTSFGITMLRWWLSALARNAVKLQPVTAQLVTQFFGNFFLKRLDLGVEKFDNLT